MRYESTNGVVRLWNDAIIKLKDFTDFAHFFAACVQNNIQLNRKLVIIIKFNLVGIIFGKFKLTIYGMLCGTVSELLLWML